MPGGSWRRGLGLLPGLSWDGGMLLYVRHSGLMLGSVPGHVLSHVCGYVRSMCPVWVCQYSNTLLGIQYTCRGCPKHLGLALVCLPGYRGALASATATLSDSVSARRT